MFVRERDWEVVRDQFTEEEKVELRKHVIGQVLCPMGWTLDDEAIPEPLRTKHSEALLSVMPH